MDNMFRHIMEAEEAGYSSTHYDAYNDLYGYNEENTGKAFEKLATGYAKKYANKFTGTRYENKKHLVNELRSGMKESVAKSRNLKVADLDDSKLFDELIVDNGVKAIMKRNNWTSEQLAEAIVHGKSNGVALEPNDLTYLFNLTKKIADRHPQTAELLKHAELNSATRPDHAMLKKLWNNMLIGVAMGGGMLAITEGVGGYLRKKREAEEYKKLYGVDMK